jgi:FtsZ-interacting cell division protein YlmF
MAVVEVGVRLTGKDDGAGKTVGNIKTALKEANKELVQAQSNFGAMSAEAIAAAKKVAELRDSIQEAREVADLFDPGKKLAVLGNVAKTVAGGFGALTGTMALFGTESKDVEKTLLKVQSAMAITEGLNVIMDSGKEFSRLGAMIKGPVVKAFSTLKGALLATGIGALVVGLGLVIANFDAIKKTLSNLIPGFGAFADKIGGIITMFTDWIGVTDSAARALERLEGRTKIKNEGIERTIKLLQAQGGKEVEIYELTKKTAQNDIAVLRSKVDKKGLLYGEDAKKYKDLVNDIAVMDANEKRRLDEKLAGEVAANKSKHDQLAAANKKAHEDKKAEEAKQAAEDLKNREKVLMDLQEIDRKISEDKRKTEETKLAEQVEFEAGRAAALAKAPIALMNANKLATDTIIDNNNQAAKNAEIAAAMQIAAYQNIGGALAGLSDIVGRQTVAGKILALAQIGIDTALAISGVVRAASQNRTNVTPFQFYADIFARSVLVLTTMAKAKNVLKGANPAGALSGGGGSPSASQAAQAAPLQPQAQSVNTRLDAQSLNQLGNAASRAYVVESDVTGNQERIRRLNRAARLG